MAVVVDLPLCRLQFKSTRGALDRRRRTCHSSGEMPAARASRTGLRAMARSVERSLRSRGAGAGGECGGCGGTGVARVPCGEGATGGTMEALLGIGFLVLLALMLPWWASKERP